MFRPLLFFVALLGLASVSCSSVGKIRSDYTKADLATLRLRDLNPLARSAPVVHVHQATLQAISEERLAQMQESRGFLWFRKPVNWTPPSLPEGALDANGSLLPPKSGTLAVSNRNGFLPDNQIAASNPRLTAEGRQDFSIE
ncbi:MAG: hypothetical protein O3A92_06705 [Verrucomicrobia bacterium]|nr:hypothetical protein [Verrucomicrobiota bacterium]